MTIKQRNEVYRKAYKQVLNSHKSYICCVIQQIVNGDGHFDVFTDFPEVKLFQPHDYHDNDPFTHSYYNDDIQMGIDEQKQFRLNVLQFCIEMTKHT